MISFSKKNTSKDYCSAEQPRLEIENLKNKKKQKKRKIQLKLF